MRQLGLVIGLSLLPALTVLWPAETIAGEEAQVDAAYIKLVLTHDGKTYAHPGFRVAKDEQGVFVIECDGKNHEIAVVLRSASADKLDINVEYSVDGTNVLTQDLTVDAGKDAELSKGKTKLTINVDPRGKKDTSRKDGDKIDGPKGDDPL